VLSGKDIVLVFDGWWDRYGKRSYLGVIARYVDKDAKQMKNKILAIRELPHPHTSVHIRACMINVMHNYGVDEKQVRVYFY
jgi:hypothetical protein